MSTELETTGMPEGDDANLALPGLEVDLGRLTDVSVELAVEVGRTYMSLGEAMALGPGSVVTLDRLADKPVDLLINGRSIARGEVVVIDEQFGLRITEVVSTVAADTSTGPQPEFVSMDSPAGTPELALAPEPDASLTDGEPVADLPVDDAPPAAEAA